MRAQKNRAIVFLWAAASLIASCTPAQETSHLSDIPTEYENYFEFCDGLPSIEITPDESKNNDLVTGYCEINGEKFIHFSLTNPARANPESLENKIKAKDAIVEIPEEFKSLFTSCSGTPSWEETIAQGRPAVVGYCEHNGEKFTQFTIDDPRFFSENIDEKNDKDFYFTTVPLGTLNGSFYLSPRNFPSVGQSMALDIPINLKWIAVSISDRVTLLTPEGVEKFRKDPTGMSISAEEASEVEVTLFDDKYSFPAQVEVFIYKHKSGPFSSRIDVRNQNVELVFQESKQTIIKLQSLYKTEFQNDLMLDPGYYLFVWRITNPPEEVLSIFLSGRTENLDGSNNAYQYGRTYSAGFPEYLFDEDTTKSGKTDGKGGDIWCRGDLQVFIEGTKLATEKFDLQEVKDLPRGNSPDIQNCWSGQKRP